MRTTDELFQLIKSLTKSEKRYFKLQTSVYGGEKNYLKLFDAIDAQETYDEKKLREMFEGEPFMRQLSVAKNYLYEQIMRALRAYHAKSTIRSQIRNLLHSTEILYHKELRDQARKTFQAALELALEHEDYIGVLEALGWRERAEPEIADMADGIDQLYDPMREWTDRLRDYLDHAVAWRKVRRAIKAGHLRTQAALDELEDAIRLLSGKEEDALSLRAAFLYCWTYATYHYGRQEFPQALHYYDRLMELMETNTMLTAIYPVAFIDILNQKLATLAEIEDIDTFWDTTEKMRIKGEEFIAQSNLRGPRLRAYLFLTLYHNQIELHLAERETVGYQVLIREVEEGLRTHRRYIAHDMAPGIYHGLSRLYFDLKEFDRALEYNNLIVQGPVPKRTPHIYYHARLMHLVIHYELGNFDLLEYLVRSTYRYFRSRNIIHRFEGAVLEFFRRLLRVRGGRREVIALFEEMHDVLSSLRSDPLEAKAFSMFHYVEWLEEKIQEMKRGGSAGGARSF